MIPVVPEAKRRGYRVEGHIGADSVFHLGLPFLRTSVDHGTAFDIAGTEKASAVSMVVVVSPALPRKRTEIIIDSA